MPASRLQLSPAFFKTPNWWASFVGIPFAWNGSTREGVSCWGLVCLVYKDVFGIRLPRFNELETQIEKGAGSFADFASTGEPVPLDEVRSGDVLHMWGVYKGKRRATHCGVVTEPGFVLHAEEVVGSCVSRYKGDSRFLHRVIGAYRLE